MRTTVTLEPEAERLLREAMRRRRQSFKVALNQAVLKGLADLKASEGNEAPFEVESSLMRILPGHDPGHLNRLSDDLEAQAFVELTARLAKDDGKR